MKNSIAIILIFIISVTNLKALDMSYANQGIETEITMTDSSFEMTLDLGLNVNLLQDLQDTLTSKLDGFFNPYIEDLKDMRKENIKKLNYEDSPTSGLTNDIMTYIGLNDGIFVTKKICDEKNDSSFCDYYGKDQYFEFSSLNPFTEFRKDVIEQHAKLVKQVKEIGADFERQFNEAWDKALSDANIDGGLNEYINELFAGDIVTDYLTEAIENNRYFQNESVESNAIKALLTDPSKSPQQIAMAYAKETNPDLYRYDDVQLKHGSNASRVDMSNNLCDLALGMFDTNSDVQDKLNERLSKLRQELYKHATYLLLKMLTDELGLMTLMQNLSKMTQCAVEATIASTNSLRELFSMPSFASSAALDAINDAKNSSGTSAAKPVTFDVSNHRTQAQKAQDCMQELADKNKKETDLEAEVGLSNFGVTFFPLTLLDLWVFSPLSNLALGVKGKINWVTQYFKSDADYERCLLAEGETSVWQQAYHSCMAGNSGIEFKIKSELNKEIAKLFNTVRKNKKNDCELLEESTKLNLFNFDKIKLLMEPTPSVGPFVDNGKLNYFGGFVSKLVQAKIETPNWMSAEISMYKKELDAIRGNEPFEIKKADGTVETTRKFKTMQDFMDCGGVDTVNGGAYSCSTPGTVGIRNFCSYEVEDLIVHHDFQQILKDTTTNTEKEVPTFSDRIKLRLANIHYCSQILADLIEHPVEQEVETAFVEPEDSIQGTLGYILDKKWMLETKQLTQKEFNKAMRVIKGTQNRFAALTEGEKIDICIKSKKRENILNPSIMYKLCKAFKIKKFNELFIKAKIEYKSMPYSSKTSFAKDMQEIKMKSEELTDTYDID